MVSSYWLDLHNNLPFWRIGQVTRENGYDECSNCVWMSITIFLFFYFHYYIIIPPNFESILQTPVQMRPKAPFVIINFEKISFASYRLSITFTNCVLSFPFWTSCALNSVMFPSKPNLKLYSLSRKYVCIWTSGEISRYVGT